MGFFDDLGRAGLGFATGGLSEVLPLAGKKLSGADQQLDQANQMQSDLANQRNASKQAQLGYLNQMQAPQMSPQMQARLQALDTESQPGPLVSDPYFQGARANTLNSGAQQLSAINNTKNAYGIGAGGFKNVGSEQDVQDRLGVAMANLGQQSVGRKEQVAQQAAQMHQNYTDALTNYNNAILQAKAHIEAGDSAAASQAIQAAYAARQQADAASRQMTGQLIGLGGTLGSAALTGGASAAPMVAQQAAPMMIQGGQMLPASNYGEGGLDYQSMPYSGMTRNGLIYA